MTIDQGDTLVTPLQLATAYAAIQNDGHVCVPHVWFVIAPDGTWSAPSGPTATVPARISENYLRTQRARRRPAERHGGHAFRGFPFAHVWVAGKTGTAQVDAQQDNSWFAAMTEGDGEQHVIVVVVEQGGHGSTTAAPIVRHVIEGLYGLRADGAVGAEVTD